MKVQFISKFIKFTTFKKYVLRLTALWLMLPASVFAIPILDQENTGTLTLNQGVGHIPGSFGNPIVAQTFTVGITGELAGVDVFINNQAAGVTTGTDLIAEIYAVTASLPSGAALASTTISESLIPGGGHNFFNIDFSSYNLGIGAGEELAVLLRESNNNPNTVYSWGGSAGNSYTGGMSTFDVGSGFVNTGYDFFFRTYVSVPEPSILALIIMGLIGIAYSRGRKGHA